MPANYQISRSTLTLTGTPGAYSATAITLLGGGSDAHAGLLGVTVLIEAPVASAIVELWLLSAGSDPSLPGSYFLYKTVSGSGDTFPLASWPAAQVRAQSGGTSGSLVINASAD